MPEVPTVAESGDLGFETTTWFGVLAPALTPAPIVTRLSSEIVRVLRMPSVQDKMTGGAGDLELGAQAFALLLKTDTDKWSRIVREAGVKAE